MNNKEMKTKGKDKKKIKLEKEKEQKKKEEVVNISEEDPRSKKTEEKAKALENDAKKRIAKKLAEEEDEKIFKEVSQNTIKKGQRIDKISIKREQKVESDSYEKREIEQIDASGIDDALSLLEVSTGSGDKHPEKRVKASFESWSEKRLAELKKENSLLRLSQYNELLQKEWKRSPENPMNWES
jgi:hypothetical protein